MEILNLIIKEIKIEKEEHARAIRSLLCRCMTLRVTQPEDMLIGTRVFGHQGSFLLQKVCISALLMVPIDHVVNELLLLQIVALIRYNHQNARNKRVLVKSINMQSRMPSHEYTYRELWIPCNSFVCQRQRSACAFLFYRFYSLLSDRCTKRLPQGP